MENQKKLFEEYKREKNEIDKPVPEFDLVNYL